ncbi:Lrp/AsnC family transcriptional regulator [Conexibacter sp. JD483]|uniref:Lrp/AsnC family transcriptional regulator n=1 Tax=unclassified Conexibacter TaxID=2627773 RepID=UPI00271D0B36|nr:MULTISPECIES: Lrp/AsnC family transcriptional regulator [unclassified Conexibacter]MDO8188899.1 Lrp/AsnC family transcriptional regulator [Conexibacter sp. CPCC 205706]MDO8200254.1 Lrp/AsnC family transcriptional regulator [Conexibacter sp. CPCC 205762]MDR9371625.1 Lrp/AsnC family transcriptional regulator [Conexibacter sp. JD483]
MIDALDRRIIHALIRDGRQPFRRVATALGCSEQTVARRYRRLREAGVVRVIVIRDPRRALENGFLRIRTKPGAARAIATALARRDDVSWLTLEAGGAELTCSLRADDPRDRDALVIERLPQVGHVTDVTFASLLHIFAASGGRRPPFGDTLDAAEEAALGPARARPGGFAGIAGETLLEPGDEPLLRLLARDGRSSYAALAAATGRSEAAVGRRVELLLERGALFVSTEVAKAPLGLRTLATLWLTVAPADLVAVGEELARHVEVEFVGAISGAANLVVSLACRDNAGLYRYLTGPLAAVTGVDRCEVVVAGARLKQAGTVMDGDRLPNPLAEEPASGA